MLPIHVVTDVPRTKTDADAYRCFGSTDAYVGIMLMHKVWMTEIPRFRHEIPRFQAFTRPQALDMRISSGQTYWQYICADADACRCFGPQMFSDANVYRCLRLTDTSDVYASNIIIYAVVNTMYDRG